MARNILLGDEAVALGAVHAGVSSAYGYPGTPATEILEFLIRHEERHRRPHAAWCANEKTAFEAALGTSFAGRRALVSMKHVGLNVAADPFMNSAITGANGGFLVVSADDPGMHSSQNEQDSRYYVQFAQIPGYEPSDHQEAYDMAREAFDVSERFGLPVELETRVERVWREGDTYVVSAGSRRFEAANVIVASGAASSRPLGIVTDRDLVLAVMAEGLDAALFTVGDIMSTQPVCADEQSSLLDAVALMREHSLRRLPVLDAAGRVVGVLTLEDVLDALAREFVDLTLALRAARDRERSQRR